MLKPVTSDANRRPPGRLWADDGLDVLSFWIYMAWFAISDPIRASAPGPEERRTRLGRGGSPQSRLGSAGQAGKGQKSPWKEQETSVQWRVSLAGWSW
jgi:hypothetical protein